MFDTMTITKIGGGLCGSLLVFLLLSWAADTIYSTDAGGHGGQAEAAYVIEVVEVAAEAAKPATETAGTDAATSAEPPVKDFAALLADPDLARGKKVFSKCRACHQIKEGKKGVGPNLFGIVNRDVASLEGFKYSKALVALEGNWTPEVLNKFVKKPKDFVKGTKMQFSGLKKEADRANLIAYLATIGN